MSKKLTSLADLAKMQFDNLAPDPEPQAVEETPFEKQYESQCKMHIRRLKKGGGPFLVDLGAAAASF